MTTIDDLPPEGIPYITDKIMDSGAKNVHIINALTKKGRMEYIVLVDFEEEYFDDISSLLALEFGTIGMKIFKHEHKKFPYELIEKKVLISINDSSLESVAKIKYLFSDDNKLIVLEDIIKYKKDIKEAIENGKYFLVTGNAIELFGEGIISLNNELAVTLETFKYQVKEEEFRIVGEQFYETDLIKNKIIGFQNRSSVMINVKEDGLFKVLKGTGYKPDEIIEGIHYNNFYGTYLLGPILVRNPYFTDYLVKDICDSLDVKFKADTDGMAYKAYHEYIKNFHGEQ